MKLFGKNKLMRSIERGQDRIHDMENREIRATVSSLRAAEKDEEWIAKYVAQRFSISVDEAKERIAASEE